MAWLCRCAYVCCCRLVCPACFFSCSFVSQSRLPSCLLPWFWRCACVCRCHLVFCRAWEPVAQVRRHNNKAKLEPNCVDEHVSLAFQCGEAYPNLAPFRVPAALIYLFFSAIVYCSIGFGVALTGRCPPLPACGQALRAWPAHSVGLCRCPFQLRPRQCHRQGGPS